MTALSCELIRCHFVAIESICDFYSDRSLFCGVSLIVDVVAISLPCQVITVLCELLITVRIRDVCKVRSHIIDGILTVFVYQVSCHDGI